MQVIPEVIGRAKTVLVFGAGPDTRGVVTAVVARIRQGRTRRRLYHAGPVVFAPDTWHHLNEAVLPVVDNVVRRLGLPPANFELSVVNLGLGGAKRLTIRVEGYSVDTAAFCALLSAALKLPMRQDVVTTGHIASPDGDLRIVHSLPAKLAAAAAQRGIRRFACPGDDADQSLQNFAPGERERVAAALTGHLSHTVVFPVSDLTALLKAAATEDSCALAALRSGFFGSGVPTDDDGSVVGQLTEWLRRDAHQRIWEMISTLLQLGRGRQASQALRLYVGHHLQEQRYPKGIGSHLSQTVAALSPGVRRAATLSPLLSARTCAQLARLAEASDEEDVQWLLLASRGNVGGHTVAKEAAVASSTGDQGDAAVAVEAVLSAISAETLAERVGLSIDAARAAFVLPTVIAESHEDFCAVVSAFYASLLRRSGVAPVNFDGSAALDEAMALLSRAFAGRGGEQGAEAEARCGEHSGLRLVIDVMTDQYKREQQAKYVSRVLKEALDPLDWQVRVRFMGELLRHLGPALPAEMRTAPPARFARRCEEIVTAYVQSLSQVCHLFRAL